MLIEQTLDKLNAMKLTAMADAWRQQIQTDEATALSFDERLGLLVDTEWTAREQRKLERRLRTARLRYPATLEAVDFTHPRRLKRQQLLTLGTCAWIAERHNLILLGPTGIGKSFLACALVERACRRGFAARYVRMPRLLHELAVGRGDGSYTRLLARLAKLDLLAIDDWMLAPLRDPERRDLTEVIEDRAERASTLIASQTARHRLARRHRRPQPSRRDLRPPALTTRTASSSRAARCDGHTTHPPTAGRRRHDDYVGETPDPPAESGQPVDPAGAMENARDTPGGNATVAESAFPTAPWTPPQAAPTGTTGILLDARLHDRTSRISTRRYDTDGRQLTNERRYAPMSALHFTEIRDPHPRNR